MKIKICYFKQKSFQTRLVIEVPEALGGTCWLWKPNKNKPALKYLKIKQIYLSGSFKIFGFNNLQINIFSCVLRFHISS